MELQSVKFSDKLEQILDLPYIKIAWKKLWNIKFNLSRELVKRDLKYYESFIT